MEEKPEKVGREAKRQRREEPTTSQKMLTPPKTPKRPTMLTEAIWASKPPSWPKKQPQEEA